MRLKTAFKQINKQAKTVQWNCAAVKFVAVESLSAMCEAGDGYLQIIKETTEERHIYLYSDNQ